MSELTAKTQAGARLVELAEALAEELATRAALHDRDASFPHASIAALARERYFAAPIPVEHGGLGATSVHDVVVASSRLARGDASVAIGVNMHLVILMNIVRRWQIAVAAGDERRAEIFGASMGSIARDGVIIAAAISEHGQDLTRPRTTATRTGTGWRIDGRKAFCTMSPAATVLYTAVTFVDDDGVARYGYAQVPTDARRRDRRRLGRARHARLGQPLDHLRRGRAAALRATRRLPRRRLDAYMERNLAAGLFHASASLGIAESAAAAVASTLAARGEPDAHARTLLAQNVVELGAARATLGRSARSSTSPTRTPRRCSPRPRRRRPSSTRRRCASSIGPSPSRAAPATSAPIPSRAPTATCAPAGSCIRSEPIAPTSCSATSRSAASSSCTSGHPSTQEIPCP